MSELKQLINSAEEMIKDEESPEKVLNALLTDLKAYEKFNGWIPVSERLPEDNIGVNVTFENKDGDRFTGDAWLQEGRWIYKWNVDKRKVIAWQPLPEPWEGVNR